MGKTDDLRSDVENLRDDLRTLRGDIAELTNGLVNAGQSSVHDLNERLQREVRHRASQARNVFHEARERGEHAVDATRHQIEERPLVSVAGAFGLGMVVGMLMNRRN